MNEVITPDHLGGHLNKVHVDVGTLSYINGKYDVKSMVDIGCGPGDMVNIALDRNINAIGIDGDPSLDLSENHFIRHDFTLGKPDLGDKTFDLGWSVEFLEHVEEQYLDNFMSVFERCSYVVCTAAPPGWPGHHHVNCQPIEYWIEKFSNYGLLFDINETNVIRQNYSTMRKPFMQQNGMFYRKK